MKDQQEERNAQAALRTVASLIQDRRSDADCVRDISYLLTLCGVAVEYRPLDETGGK